MNRKSAALSDMPNWREAGPCLCHSLASLIWRPIESLQVAEQMHKEQDERPSLLRACISVAGSGTSWAGLVERAGSAFGDLAAGLAADEGQHVSGQCMLEQVGQRS